jgi:hypothetical protein
MANAPSQMERDRLEREIERREVKRRALDVALGEFLHEVDPVELRSWIGVEDGV